MNFIVVSTQRKAASRSIFVHLGVRSKGPRGAARVLSKTFAERVRALISEFKSNLAGRSVSAEQVHGAKGYAARRPFADRRPVSSRKRRVNVRLLRPLVRTSSSKLTRVCFFSRALATIRSSSSCGQGSVHIAGAVDANSSSSKHKV